jgi:hypothetical protein
MIPGFLEVTPTLGFFITIIRERINAPLDDGDCTETCRSCFNVNFN